MLYSFFGAPSAFVNWSGYVLQTMFGRLLEHTEFVSANELNAFKARWNKRSQDHILLSSDCPEKSLTALFVDNNVPLIILTEDPSDTTGYITKDRKISWPIALRISSQCITTVSELSASRRALTLRREDNLSFSEFLHRSGGHFGLTLNDEDIIEILKAVAPRKRTPSPDIPMEHLMRRHWPKSAPPGWFFAKLPREAQEVIAPLHAGLRAIQAGERPARIEWPTMLLVNADRRDKPLMGPIDLLGPSRCICFGPYLTLPRGRWVLSLTFAVRENLSGNTLVIDIAQGEAITVVQSLPLPAEGRFVAEAVFDVTDARSPIQIRLYTVQGAIEGVIDILALEARPVG